MLRFLGKRNRSRNALLIFFVAVLAIGLVIAFVPTFSNVFSGDVGSDATVADVVGYKVTAKEFREALALRGQQISRTQGAARQDSPATIYALYGQQILDDLIRQKLVRYHADELNLLATDEEVRARLRQVFNPWPGVEQYRSRLRQAGYSEEQFEDDLRSSLAEEKLRGFVTAAAQVSPQEVEDEYRRNKTTYSFRWVEVQPSQFKDNVRPTDSDLLAYFDQHRQEFRVNNEQRSARYIFIDQAKAGETIQVSDDELRRDFDPERGVQQVRVSQIVLNVPEAPAAAPGASSDKTATPGKPAETEDDVRKKADEIVKRARGEGDKPAEPFAGLARELSQDTRSRASGGDLGWVNKKDKRESDDPLNRVFTMKKDEVSAPIKKGNKFYILKVTDRKLPTFEESREQLLKEARVTKGYSKAVEIATEAEQKFKESRNADAVVAEINQKNGLPIAEVRESGFFTEEENPSNLGFGFASSVFDLENAGDIGERQNVTGGFAVAQYVEKRDPHDPPFEEAKAKVEEVYQTNRAKELALQRARQLAGSKSPDDLKSAASSLGLKAEDRSGLSGSDSFGPVTSEGDRIRAQKIDPGHVAPEPLQPYGSDGYVVVALMSRTDADMGEPFQKERKAVEERLLEEKRNALFSSFMVTTQKRLNDEGKIRVYYETIEKVVGGGEPVPLRPGAPLAPGGSRRRSPNPR